MQKFAILTLMAMVLWVAAFGLPGRVAIAWQEPEPPPTGAPAQADAEPDDTEEAVESPLLGPPIDPEVAAQATSLLQQARDRLYAYQSVEADMVERAAFGDRRFRAEGTYQAGPFPQLRLEYRLRVGGSEGIVIEVCDGQILRTSRRIRPVGSDADEIDPAQYQVSRKDVRKILQASDVEGTPPEAVLQAELGIGGLPALLAAIERTMEFEAVQEQTYQGETFLVVQGRWRLDFLEGLGDDPILAAAAQQSAPFIPERVRVYLHHETLFPMRILYLKRATIDPLTYRAIMSIEFSNVKLNEGGFDTDTFRFSAPPDGVPDFDETNLFVEMIENYRTQQEAAAEGSAETPASASETAGEN